MYIPTASWKQLEPKRVVPHPMTSKGIPVPLVVLHHSVTAEGPFEPILRAIDRYHHSGVYDDIAYNGAASNTEDKYTDLRGPLVQGGATGKWNGEVIDRRSLSVVVLGDFQTKGMHTPTIKVVENTAQLVARWIRAGHVTRDFRLEPHRNYRSTSCCGDRLIAVIDRIRERVDAILEPVVEEKDIMTVPIEDWNKEFIRGDNSGKYNAAVELWQRLLVAAGFDPGPLDGVRGPATEAANMMYEVETGIRDVPNGYPEPDVWRALLENMLEPIVVEVPAPVDPEVLTSVQRIRRNADRLAELLM